MITWTIPHWVEILTMRLSDCCRRMLIPAAKTVNSIPWRSQVLFSNNRCKLRLARKCTGRLRRRSPCVLICKLDSRGTCVGCFRKMEEIAGWLKMSDYDKSLIIAGPDERGPKCIQT